MLKFEGRLEVVTKPRPNSKHSDCFYKVMGYTKVYCH